MVMVSLAAVVSAVAVVKESTKLVGVSPATKVLGTADVYVTDPALAVDTRVDTNSKVRKIIVGCGLCWCGEWSWIVNLDAVLGGEVAVRWVMLMYNVLV